MIPFADKLRALGLPTMDEDGDYFQSVGADLCQYRDGWSYCRQDMTRDPRRWPTAEEAVNELYAEMNEGSPGVATEPTVDEMAREMGLYRGIINAPGHHAHEEPAWFADERMIPGQFGALYVSRAWGPDWTPRSVWTCRNDRTAGYATDARAIQALYRNRPAPVPDTPPTDLARWLYDRVMPGVWAEHRIGSGRSKGAVLEAHEPNGEDLGYLRTHGACVAFVPDGDGDDDDPRLVRLLNPDGSVLWEAK